MALLFLIRHGLTAQTGTFLYGRTPGIPLDERGRAQAAHLAERFEGVRLTAVYSSPLERCVQTVEPLAAAQRLPVRAREGLIEMDAGSWTGKRLATLRTRAAWREVQGSPSTFRFPDGEGFAEARDRVVTEVLAIAKRHRRGRVAIGTHGDVVRMLLSHFGGAPLDAFQRVVADTAGVSVVAVQGEAVHVVLANDPAGPLARFGKGAPPPWEAAGTAKVRG
jgi:probable phosphoglycerate mutase